MKPIFEKIAACCGLLVLSPLLIGIGISIKLEDGGSVLFKQERVGRDGKLFICYKFRTMFHNAEDLLEKWKESGHPNWTRYVESNFKLQEDPRVTKTGKFLRRTSFDELAQLFNVLRGDMNLVGPRPLLAREVDVYGKARFEQYCQMKPGLTGLWQVSGRSNTTFDTRAQLDMEYLGKKSFSYDVKILLKTLLVLIRRDGAY